MKSFIAAAALGVAAWAGSANATAFTITETGTIVGDDNTYGDGLEFGAVAVDLIGLKFSVTYQFDTDDGSLYQDAYGSYYSGPGTAAITINGVTRTIAGLPDQSSSNRNNNDPSWGPPSAAQWSNVVQADYFYDFVEDYLTPMTPFASTDLSAPYYHLTAGDYLDYVYGDVGDTHFHGTIETFAANGAVAPVPEAASWAMMLAGFGLVGGAMRRRKARIAFA